MLGLIGRWRRHFQLAALGSVCLLAACAQRELAPVEAPRVHAPAQAWTSFHLPGKRPTSYRHGQRDGRAVILAEAEASASMYRQHLRIEPDRLGSISFSWWVPALMADADLSLRGSADSPVRIVLAFDGDRSRLSSRNRALFELAETLSGEPPPYATLMYVWDNRSALETVLPGGRTDRIRKIVVDSGPTQLQSWRHHRRDIVRDYERAFGEPPGRLIAVGLMTDSDNTASRAQAVYGELVLTSRAGEVNQLNE